MGNSDSSTNISGDNMSEAIEFVKSENANNEVVIWSKSYCGYSSMTKRLFQSIGVDAKVHELDRMPNGSDIQIALQKETGQRTVPNVFVKNRHLGGNDDTHQAHASGLLQKMLAK